MSFLRNLKFSGSPFVLLAAGLLIGSGLGILILFGFSLSGPLLEELARYGEDSPASLAPASERTASDFELQTPDGEKVSLASLRGRPVVINFWATWCGPCQQEMPLLQAAHVQYGADLVVLGINFEEPNTLVEPFIADLGLSFPILMDADGRVKRLYRVRAFPTTFFLDTEGVIRYEHIGLLSEKQLAGYLEKLGVGE